MPDPQPPPAGAVVPPGRHLDSWGEIAAYLHRSVSTVQRWEKQEGLPVRRIAHSKLGSVYATTDELDHWYLRRSQQAPALPSAAADDRITLAVLPFRNLSGSAEQDYFSDGLTEELITYLATLRPERLAVIARTSAMQYRDTARDVRAIGGELGVGYVLEGSVRRGEHRVRVTAHLVATADGMHLWADTYEQPVADVLEIQSAIAERVGDSLSIHLFSEQTTAHAQAAQTSPEARDEFLKGRHLCHMRTAEGFRSAIRHFERAIELDGRFAPAHAGLAETYAILGFWGYGVLPPRAAYPPARASAEQAVRLDPSLAQAHATLGFVQYAYDWDWAGSERSLRRALELDPSYATGHQRYASLLALQRRLPEALEEIDRALALDPRSLLVNLTMAWLHYFARDDEAAREHCRRTLELKPDFPTTHLLLAAVHSLAGRAEEALAEHEAFDRLGGPPSVGLMERACHFARVGESARAGHYLADLRRRHAAGQAFSWQLAVVHAALAEPDAAFAALEKALEERSDVMAFLKIEPHWDPLRGDARFTRLLERVGLA